MTSSLRILFCLAPSVLGSAVSSQTLPAADSVALVRLEREWNEAHLRGDVETLVRLWADELTVTVPSMPPMDKSESVAFARSGRMAFSRYETTDLGVRVYDDAAIVTGRLQRTRTLSGQEVLDDWRFIKVYVRRHNRWEVVAFHASPTAR